MLRFSKKFMSGRASCSLRKCSQSRQRTKFFSKFSPVSLSLRLVYLSALSLAHLDAEVSFFPHLLCEKQTMDVFTPARLIGPFVSLERPNLTCPFRTTCPQYSPGSVSSLTRRAASFETGRENGQVGVCWHRRLKRDSASRLSALNSTSRGPSYDYMREVRAGTDCALVGGGLSSESVVHCAVLLQPGRECK